MKVVPARLRVLLLEFLPVIYFPFFAFYVCKVLFLFYCNAMSLAGCVMSLYLNLGGIVMGGKGAATVCYVSHVILLYDIP